MPQQNCQVPSLKNTAERLVGNIAESRFGFDIGITQIIYGMLRVVFAGSSGFFYFCQGFTM